MALIRKISIITGTWNEMELEMTEEQEERYRKGSELVQDIFPDMPAEHREFLISGMNIDEQNEYFQSGPQSSRGFHGRGGEYYHIGDF